jgi:uncharacterized membrane protein YidH (DUF202 family)
MARPKPRLTSSKDTAGNATFGAMAPLFPMQLSSSLPVRDAPGLSLVRGAARSPSVLLIVLSLWLTVFGNLPLWQRVAALTTTADHRLGLMLALGLVLVAGTLALLALCHWPRVFRPAATVMALTAAANSHFMWQYGVVIDSTMMVNVAQTNVNEIRDLLSWPLLLAVLAIAGPALWWVWRAPPAPLALVPRLRHNLGLLALSLAVAAVALLAGYQGLASLMRNHKDLRYMINPMNTLVASGTVLAEHSRHATRPLLPVGEDARLGASYARRAGRRCCCWWSAKPRGRRTGASTAMRAPPPPCSVAGRPRRSGELLAGQFLRHQHPGLRALHVLAAHTQGRRRRDRAQREPAGRAAARGAGCAVVEQPVGLQGRVRPSADSAHRAHRSPACAKAANAWTRP